MGLRMVYLESSVGTFESIEFNNGHYAPNLISFPMKGGLFLNSVSSSLHIDSCNFTGTNMPNHTGGLIYIEG